MAQAKLNDVTNYVAYDSKHFTYKLTCHLEDLPFQFQTILKDKIDPNTNQILLPTIDEILLASYPFVDKPNEDVVNKIIKRNRRIVELVDYAAEHKRGEKLDFDDLGEKDDFIIRLAKDIVFDLNKVIYKYEIDTFFGSRTFINNDVNNPFIGTLPLLGRSKDNWYLFNLKFSRTNFTQKYMAEIFLDKKLFDTNTKFKIKEAFVLNPRQEQYLLNAYDISKGEQWSLENYKKIK